MKCIMKIKLTFFAILTILSITIKFSSGEVTNNEEIVPLSSGQNISVENPQNDYEKRNMRTRILHDENILELINKSETNALIHRLSKGRNEKKQERRKLPGEFEQFRDMSNEEVMVLAAVLFVLFFFLSCCCCCNTNLCQELVCLWAIWELFCD